jgi:hypothetical protein
LLLLVLGVPLPIGGRARLYSRSSPRRRRRGHPVTILHAIPFSRLPARRSGASPSARDKRLPPETADAVARSGSHTALRFRFLRSGLPLAHPGLGDGHGCISRCNPKPTKKGENLMSNITPGHVRVFQAVRSQLYDNITLASCTIDGEPGVAIVMVDDCGEGKVAVMPLFVAITPNMKLTFPGEGESDGGGGPKNPREAFAANKAATRPSPGS